jgi:hypothetical protein
MNIYGKFLVENWYRDQLIGLYRFPNDATGQGKDRFLDVSFNHVPQITNWWMGIIDYTGYTALAATDLYRNINLAANGWKEFTDYTDENNGDSAITRPLWNNNTASGQSISNTTYSIFNVTTAGTIKGMFIVGGSASAQIKGDNTAGNSVLWATGLFDTGDCNVVIGSRLRIIYTIGA